MLHSCHWMGQTNVTKPWTDKQKLRFISTSSNVRPIMSINQIKIFIRQYISAQSCLANDIENNFEKHTKIIYFLWKRLLTWPNVKAWKVVSKTQNWPNVTVKPERWCKKLKINEDTIVLNLMPVYSKGFWTIYGKVYWAVKWNALSLKYLY